MDRVERLVLGLVPVDRLRARDPRTRQFVRALEQRTGFYIVERTVGSYDELERAMTLGHIDFAWLPPIVFARLERADVVVPLASRIHGQRRYWSVLVAAAGSPIASVHDLAGLRVAWVDPLSAAGYVVARAGLLDQGVDPREVFEGEFFAGSHAEAVRAVIEGRADVAATFAHIDEAGRVTHGPWAEMGVAADSVKVVAALGEIPADLVAARVSVPSEVRDALAAALIAITHDESLAHLVEAIFGGRHFELGASPTYGRLRDLLERTSSAGLGGASDAYVSTNPPTTG